MIGGEGAQNLRDVYIITTTGAKRKEARKAYWIKTDGKSDRSWRSLHHDCLFFFFHDLHLSLRCSPPSATNPGLFFIGRSSPCPRERPRFLGKACWTPPLRQIRELVRIVRREKTAAHSTGRPVAMVLVLLPLNSYYHIRRTT